MQEINVEQIMEEIRAEIKTKGYKASDLSFNDIPLKSDKEELGDNSIDHDLNLLNNMWNINYYQNFGSGFKAFVKRIIRKLIKPIIYDIFIQESFYNAACTRTINYLIKRIQNLEDQIKKLEK